MITPPAVEGSGPSARTSLRPRTGSLFVRRETHGGAVGKNSFDHAIVIMSWIRVPYPQY